MQNSRTAFFGRYYTLFFSFLSLIAVSSSFAAELSVEYDLFTVFKDFSDNSSASVSVSLSCTSGTVIKNPQWASESEPAIFGIEDAAPGATCTAVEIWVPSGYTVNHNDCQDGDPFNGSCTIVNNVIPPSSDSFAVYKDFSDNNSGSVSVSLSCSSGTVTNNPQLAREGVPAVFNITGAASGATCTAVENSVPSQNGDQLNGSCTIINNRIASSSDMIMASGFE